MLVDLPLGLVGLSAGHGSLACPTTEVMLGYTVGVAMGTCEILGVGAGAVCPGVVGVELGMQECSAVGARGLVGGV